MTEKDIDRILANAKATLKVEGMKPSKAAEEITRRYLAGELTSQEAINLIVRRYV